MVVDYPTNYYGLLRVVNQQIRDYLKAMIEERDLAQTEGRVITVEDAHQRLHKFIQDLSINSGLPKKKLYGLLADHGIDLRVTA